MKRWPSNCRRDPKLIACQITHLAQVHSIQGLLVSFLCIGQDFGIFIPFIRSLGLAKALTSPFTKYTKNTFREEYHGR
jgi:hypothetical protein